MSYRSKISRPRSKVFRPLKENYVYMYTLLKKFVQPISYFLKYKYKMVFFFKGKEGKKVNDLGWHYVHSNTNMGHLVMDEVVFGGEGDSVCFYN